MATVVGSIQRTLCTKYYLTPWCHYSVYFQGCSLPGSLLTVAHITFHWWLYSAKHRRRNRGGKGSLAPPTFQGGGAEGGLRPPPTFWARTYRKVPPRSLFFHPHNSTVLTPNQSVRCFEKCIGVGTRGGGGPSPPPPCFSSVCEEWSLMLEAPSGQFFSVQRYNILHNQCVSV